VVTNNGTPFGVNDWARLKRIAEGNPDETKIGAFGVGFYSVFAVSNPLCQWLIKYVLHPKLYIFRNRY
jgi:hypothetical protein